MLVIDKMKDEGDARKKHELCATLVRMSRVVVVTKRDHDN